MRMILILSAAVLSTSAVAQTPLADQTSPAIASLESGIICPPPTVGETAAPGTLAGTTHLIDEDPPFVSQSNLVPAVIGIGFGVKSMTADLLGIQDVTVTVTHPPMGNTGVTTQSFQTRIDGTEPSLTFYQFDFAYELVEGPWELQAAKDGEVLYSSRFTVVAPTAAPALAGICGFEELLS